MRQRSNGRRIFFAHIAAMRSRFRFHVAERADPWLAGAAATLVGVLLSWRPSFWFDEAATIAAANRSEVDILRLLLNFDAVHGLYYLAMHAWFSLVPINEFTARLPSAMAVGAATAGLVVLGRLTGGRLAAWAAAGAFTVLPRTLWSAVEARSYALTAAAAVWLTVVLVIAASRHGPPLWALYALVLALATFTYVYLALMVCAHAVTLVVSRNLRQLLPFAAAVTAGLFLASPLIALAEAQRQTQLWWISGGNYLTEVLWQQWLTGSRLFLGTSIIVLAWGSIALVSRRAGGHALAVAVPWVLVPTAILVGYSAWVSDIYAPRYLTYTGPGLALLLGVCIAAIAQNRLRILMVLLTMLALSSSTAFVTQRSTYGKPGGADYSEIARVIKSSSRPHDCVVFGFAGREPLRAAAAARPDAFAQLNDVAAGVSGADAAQLWAQDLPLDSAVVRRRLAVCPVLWAIIDRKMPSPVVDAARRLGFVIDREWVLNRSTVIRLTKA
ncbi:mannosyltransferase [Mycobacterium sp. SM1]|uniref:glycosyltransferase family 39 protein n=1 Tax=Mycobacterium sp. SM1 TaxID=2816243 RepID=UPI001BD13FB4|nr:mannosyltransferase [Mycobacterium sp. SM1]MBS4728376.1 mannosyltransferase [Mycobacterium sp. SM1]